MVGGKKRTVYRKKRKGKLFAGKQKYAKSPNVSQENKPITSQENSSNSSAQTPTVSASRRKLNLPESNQIPDQAMDYEGKGYRLIDIGKFSASISEVHVCNEGKKACNLLHMFIILCLLILEMLYVLVMDGCLILCNPNSCSPFVLKIFNLF